MTNPTKEYTCYNARFAMIVICEKESDPKKTRAILDSINKQHFRATEKIIVFNNCKEPEWFSGDAYSEWIYKYCKYKTQTRIDNFALKNIDSAYYCFVNKIIAPQTLLLVTELLQDAKPKEDIMFHGLVFRMVK